MRSYLALLLLPSMGVWAQTVGTASRTLSFTPDEIVLELVIETPTETPLEEVLGWLAPLRVTQQDLKTVGTLRDSPNRLGWQLSFVRPHNTLTNVLKQIENTRRQLLEAGVPLTYQFFFRAAPKMVDGVKRRALSEMIAEARVNANASSSAKLRHISIEPTAENIDAERPGRLFGLPSGLLQYQLSVVAVFEEE